jgi:hypothetical protein
VDFAFSRDNKRSPCSSPTTWDADNVEVMVAKQGAAYMSKPAGGVSAPILNVNAFLAAHTWRGTVSALSKDKNPDPVSFSEDQRLHSNADLTKPTVPLDVQDIPGDRHNLLHYTTTPYKTAGKKNEPSQNREQGHHLTVENAHLLFLMTLKEEKTLAYLDKTTLDKPKVNGYINGQGAAGIDNLNFFPEDQRSQPLANRTIPTGKLQTLPEPDTEPLDKLLSLDDYAARNLNPDRPGPGGGTEPPGCVPVGDDGSKTKDPAGVLAA